MAFDYRKTDIAVSRLANELKPKAIVIFGSVAKQTAGDHSDLDILVVMDTDLKYHDRCAIAREIVGSIDIPVDIIVHTPEEISDEINDPYSLVHEIMRTGVVVYGTC